MTVRGRPCRSPRTGLRGLRSRVGRPGLAVLLLVGSALVGCDDAAVPASDDGRLVLRPGDSLFEHLEALVVRDQPDTHLPPGLADIVRRVGASPSWEVSEADWTAGHANEMARGQSQNLWSLLQASIGLFGPRQGLRLWRAPRGVLLDPELGAWWIEHRGEATEAVVKQRHAGRRSRSEQTWTDMAGETIFWWDWQREQLTAVGVAPPGDLELGCDLTRSELGRLEPRLVGGAPEPRDARALWTRRSLGFEDRPALSAPARTRLALRVDELAADGLDVVLGAAARIFEPAGDFLRTAPAGERRLAFVVDVVVDGVSTPVWRREVLSGEGWVSDHVDLSAWSGRTLSLVLRTEPVEGPPDFGYGWWSGLRLTGPATAPPSRPHLVLIDVDTLRADRLGCYGAERETSPRLDAWVAAEAELFEDATAPGNWTLPSTVSLLTGLDVQQHGVRDETHALASGLPTLASRLSAAGYETWARTDGGYVVPSFGCATGFDRFVYRGIDRRQEQHPAWGEALAWLEGRAGSRPVFLFLQSYQVHTPFRRDRRFDDPEAPYVGRLDEPFVHDTMVHDAHRERPLDERERAWLLALYDAGVRRMDEDVGAFLEALPRVFGDEPYLVLFTSDHGEELFDRGGFGHRRSLHTELLSVPLILRHPDGARVGRSDAPASLLDVAPTLWDAAGLEWPAGLPGRSLLRSGSGPRLRVADDRGQAVALDFDGRKLLMPRHGSSSDMPRQLFDRRVDPGEHHDLLGRDGQTAVRLEALWRDYTERFPPLDAARTQADSLDPSIRADLEAMGYLGDG